MEDFLSVLTLVILLTAHTSYSNASSDPFCSFASCPRRTLELNETDSPVILPCDNFTLINTSDTAVAGTYSYCLDGLLLSNQSTSYYTLEFDYSFNSKAICCYNHDRDTCGICYNLIVYYAPRNQDILRGPIYHFEQPYTATCESTGNPAPECIWIRRSLVAITNDTYEFEGLVFDNLIPIPKDVMFSNNGCTIFFPKLTTSHSGDYYCFATNDLGKGGAGLPTISFYNCRSRSTYVQTADPTTVKAFLNETVILTCFVSPGSDATVIQYSFNDTIFGGSNLNSVLSYPVGITVNTTYHYENCSVECILIIEHFSQQFLGQYICSSYIIFDNGITSGENVTFNVTWASTEEANASDGADISGSLIAIPLTISVILMLLIVILLVIGVLVKRRSVLNILQYPPPPYSAEQFQYDVFVSYASDTEEFAEQVMRRGLTERGYKVQTPINFIAGYTTDQSIINAYSVSRYIVILFSEEYSHDCLQLIYAYNKLERTKTNCVIPVMCGAVVPKKLKHVTYADFEVDDVVDRVAVTIGTPLYETCM